MLGYLPRLGNGNHISWLVSLQAEDGGFRVGKRKDSLINHTYYVFRSMARLRVLESIDLNACSDFEWLVWILSLADEKLSSIADKIRKIVLTVKSE